MYGIDLNNDVFRCKKPCLGKWERLSFPQLTQCDAAPGVLLGVDIHGDFQILIAE